MHEFAIAQQLIDAATSSLAGHDGAIQRLCIRLGPLAGVSKEELAFGFSVVAANTPYANAVLEIDEIPAIVQCHECGMESILTEPDLLLCPACGAATLSVLQGKELTLMSVEVASTEVVASNGIGNGAAMA
jgi:hydrogenase nickel incorporation protein HypA/HybF